MCGSDGLSSSSSLLKCGKSCRCQAETPLNALPSFTRPALNASRPGQAQCSQRIDVDLRVNPRGVVTLVPQQLSDLRQGRARSEKLGRATVSEDMRGAVRG